VDDADFQARAVREGQRARELAAMTLRECGFTDIESNAKYADLGVEVDFRALDQQGKVWLFDVFGAFSVTRPGLKRADTLWKALGKAAGLHEGRRANPARTDLGALVLLSTDLPTHQSAGGKALAAMRGPSRAVHDVVELLDNEGVQRLEGYALHGRGGG
jgi:hypothetical protein